MNPLFRGVAANDSKDLILFLLEKMHEELKIPINYNPLKEYQDIISKLKKDNIVWENFNKFPDLYKKIRIDNINWARKDKELFTNRLNKLIETAKQNKMYGEWNDYGRLN